jgi:uncharacterized protein YbjT (DUF2867 family)
MSLTLDNNNFATNRRRRVCITAAERWISNSISRGLLYEHKRSECTLVALTRDARDPHLKELEKHGAEIEEIDYDNPDTIEDALRGCNFLIFVTESDKDRIKQAHMFAKAAKNSDLCNAIVLSLEGVDEGNQKTFRDYNEIERIWKDAVKTVTILRISWLQQALFLWSENVQEKGTINMTLHERDQFVPLNLEDVVRSIRHLVTYEGRVIDELDRRHHHKIYTLTGPDSITPRDLVEMINKAIRPDGEVEYDRVNRRELEEYFRSLDDDEDRNRGLAQRTGTFILKQGFFFLHGALSNLEKGSQRALEDGVNTFKDAIDRFETAIRFLDDAQNTDLTQNIRAGNDGFRRTNSRQIVAALEQLRRFEVERILNLNVDMRVPFLGELNQAVERFTDIVQPISTDLTRRIDVSRRNDVYPAPFYPLHQTEIELVLDVLEWIKEGNAGRPTGDVRKITHREPEPIESFLRVNIFTFGIPKRLRTSTLSNGFHILG